MYQIINRYIKFVRNDQTIYVSVKHSSLPFLFESIESLLPCFPDLTALSPPKRIVAIVIDDMVSILLKFLSDLSKSGWNIS